MIITLPVELRNKIDTAVSRIDRRNNKELKAKAEAFIFNCYTDTMNANGLAGVCDYGYHRADLRKMLGTHTYTLIINELQADGIITIDSRYSKRGKKTKAYRVDTTFLDGQLISYNVPSKLVTRDDDAYSTLDILYDCTIDILGASAELANYASDDDLLLRNVRKDVVKPFYPKIRVYSRRYKNLKTLTNISHELLMDKFADDDYSIIESGKQFYLMPWDVFIRERRRKVIFSWTSAIARFSHGNFTASRDSNGRLYSNVVNLPSSLLKYVTYKKSKFREIDLKSSQWTFLNWCIQNQDDDNIISKYVKDNGFSFSHPGYALFSNLIANGTLYEEIQRWLCKETRQETKTLLFEMLFSTVKKEDSEDMAVIKNIIGPIVRLCEGVKNKYGYKSLSNELQKVEARIMIEDVLKDLHANGHPILSKHDSFLVPSNLSDELKAIIISKLDSYFGADNYSYTNK